MACSDVSYQSMGSSSGSDIPRWWKQGGTRGMCPPNQLEVGAVPSPFQSYAYQYCIIDYIIGFSA